MVGETIASYVGEGGPQVHRPAITKGRALPALLLLVLLPVIEITLFILAGAELGFWATFGLVLLTTAIGMIVLRRQGQITMGILQQTRSRLSNPAAPLAHGALIYVAGILLILPGFLTDAVGLLLLIPPLRSLIMATLVSRLSARATVFTAQGFPNAGYPSARDDIIDGDATEVFPEAPSLPRDRPSGWTNPPQ